MPPPEPTYSAADIRVLEFDQVVRTRPGMYFGVGKEDPRLATEVLCCVLAHGLHPATSVAPAHALRIEAEVSADLAFSVADDHAGPPADDGLPHLGYHRSLLGPDRWLSAAAAAMSSRAIVEIWRDGQGFRQELSHLRPLNAPEPFQAPAGSGTRIAFELDRSYFGREAAIAADLSSLDVHGPYCAEARGSGRVTIRDLRNGEPRESRYD
ncbi:hypothetical protein [Nonomuraea zeae]|uniref:Uncharacterized protein n=1 Tax=Nonomuraea zeae TaxID=1642303 RepID=A0A5S4GUB8_9ACTN|nr:hypothetical protein [Nonomuraea zeae]TMR36332.1 hypothetical protein ETD85_11065 [Nonomuraea zeae]